MHLPNIKIVKKKRKKAIIKKKANNGDKNICSKPRKCGFFLFSFSEKDGECWDLEGSRGMEKGRRKSGNAHEKTGGGLTSPGITNELRIVLSSSSSTPHPLPLSKPLFRSGSPSGIHR